MLSEPDRQGVILRALHDAQLNRDALRGALAEAIHAHDSTGSLLLASALAVCIGIADDHYDGFALAVDTVGSTRAAAADLDAAGERLLAASGELVARWVQALDDPALPALAEDLVRAVGQAAVDVSLRCAAGIVALAYFDQLLDPVKIGWVELAMRSVLREPGLNPRLADEWRFRLIRAFYLCGDVPRADALRRERLALPAPMSPAIEVKLGLLDARVGIGEARIEFGRATLQRIEPLIDARAPMWAANWHFYASRLATLENRLDDALTHARLSVRMATEARHSELWMSSFVMQEGQVLVACDRFFEAVPFFERAARAATGVQADYCRCLAHFARALGQAADGADEAQRAELAAGFALVRALAWPDFFRASPKVAARLCALALDHGIEGDLVRSIVTERQLAADRPDLAAWPWPIRVRTLGRFEIEIDGGVLSARGKGARKPLELLQFVIASGGTDVAAAGAMFALWPELEGDHARSAFNVALHRLRKLLGHDTAVVLEFGKLSVDAKTVWVDCLAFEALVDRLGQPLAASQSRDAQRAQALYVGHFLHDDETHAWMLVHRSRLASKYKRLVRALAQHWSGRGSDGEGEARNLLERAIELDPLAEDLTRELIRRLAAQGEVAAALAVFERCRATLAMSLGTRPSQATLQLVAGLRPTA